MRGPRGDAMTTDIKLILVPLDFSENSRRALLYARDLARSFGSALHLVHVCEVPTIVTAGAEGGVAPYAEWQQELGEQAERELLAESARLPGMKVTTEVLFGNPAKAIVESALCNGADMLVMGTHGHGAVMHLVAGNVAERVVRTAPCPVVTVRQPRVREEKEGIVKKLAIAGAAALAAILVLPLAASAQSEQAQFTQVTTGGEVYRTYCATCHGTAGRGDGPLAASMNKKPANLTEIAKRNGGVFPTELVFKTIDGRTPVRGHGGPDMPVWGDAFAKSREAGDQERVKSVIQSLVDYLDSIQLRPAHDQQQ